MKEIYELIEEQSPEDVIGLTILECTIKFIDFMPLNIGNAGMDFFEKNGLDFCVECLTIFKSEDLNVGEFERLCKDCTKCHLEKIIKNERQS